MSKKFMTVIPELDNAKIRRTPNGRCSVFDLIKIVGEQANPRRVWKTLSDRYPEVVQKTYNFKFFGRGQRETPVTDKEGWLYILGLLSGAMGKQYREEAAKLVIRYLDADIKLAGEIVDRNNNEGDLIWLEARTRGKITRKRVCGVYKAHGVVGRGYGKCTNMTYIGAFGTTAEGMRKKKGLKKKDNWRDSATIDEINLLAFAEGLEGKVIKKENARGNAECANICLDVSSKVAAFIRDTLAS